MSNALTFKPLNLIDGEFVAALDGGFFPKLSPHDGRLIAELPRSTAKDVANAVAAAMRAKKTWAQLPAVQRGDALYRLTNLMEANLQSLAEVVALETGKSLKDAEGETRAAIALGRFYAGEGQRLYGRTTTSGVSGKQAMTVRVPCGVAGLIIAANTPIANVAWKVFPALICGNGVVLKSAEDTPLTAAKFADLVMKADLPRGAFNLIHGLGTEAGAALVQAEHVDVISFTGSTKAGRWISEEAGKRLRKLSLELGGKNALVVCDDADLDHAVTWAIPSAFSNAGQRCASASRVIIFKSVYDAFVAKFLAKTAQLKVGPSNDDDFGPVINERQLNNMITAVSQAVNQGARLLCGGQRLTDEKHRAGFYMAPTILGLVDARSEISTTELFGPVTCLYVVENLTQAIALTNDSPYGLTACIHTRDFDRAMQFTQQVETGVVVVNGGTHGSEPHMPFGGRRQSGNGTREPGTEALDIYSELKDVYYFTRPAP